MTRTIVTIARQYGSGGHEIGQKLAEMLDVPFFDKKLLEQASQNSGIDQSFFESYDEKPASSLLFMLSTQFGEDTLPLTHKLFLAQFEAITKLASEGPCVLIGRCADYALRDFSNVVRVFIHADLDSRAARVAADQNISEHKARDIVLRMDKQRAAYYSFYAGKKWGRMENYHLCLDSRILGFEQSAELIRDFVQLKEKQKTGN